MPDVCNYLELIFNAEQITLATAARLWDLLSLSGLPTEMQVEILSYLDHVSFTCIGVICKKFYAMYLNIHAAVRLNELFTIMGLNTEMPL
jgi:hypothetical protein